MTTYRTMALGILLLSLASAPAGCGATSFTNQTNLCDSCQSRGLDCETKWALLVYNNEGRLIDSSNCVEAGFCARLRADQICPYTLGELDQGSNAERREKAFLCLGRVILKDDRSPWCRPYVAMTLPSCVASDAAKMCGGSVLNCTGPKPACPEGGVCNTQSDCNSGLVCTNKVCTKPVVACVASDAAKMCGGSVLNCTGPKPRCSTDGLCSASTDCESALVCTAGKCAVPTCMPSDPARQCGGTCPRCQPGGECTQDSDCATTGDPPVPHPCVDNPDKPGKKYCQP